MWKREYKEKLRVTADVIKKVEALNGRGAGGPAGGAAAAAAVRSANGGGAALQSINSGGSEQSGRSDASEVSFAVKKAHFKNLLQGSMKERSS